MESPDIRSGPVPGATRWSLVKLAAGRSPAARDALGEVLQHYWYPLYAWARRGGLSEHDAADGVQGFLARACESNLLAKAREERGRLRAWLLKCFQRHLRGEHLRSIAAKRGGGAIHLSVDWTGAEDLYRNEPALSESPIRLYTRTWAVSLIEEALQRLRHYYHSTGRTALHAALLPALESPLPDSTFAETAAELGTTGNALRAATQRLRNRYRAILLELASQRLGITCEAALKEELRSLLSGN